MASARAQLAKLGRRVRAVQDEGPECPPALRYLWGYFVEIMLGATVSGLAPAVITWETLRAWCDLRRVALRPWESLALVRLSTLRAGIVAEKKKAEAEP